MAFPVPNKALLHSRSGCYVGLMCVSVARIRIILPDAASFGLITPDPFPLQALSLQIFVIPSALQGWILKFLRVKFILYN